MKKILVILVLVLCMALSACAVTTGSENMLLVHEALKNETIKTGYNGNKYAYSENDIVVTAYFKEYDDQTITIYGYYSEPVDLNAKTFSTFNFEIVYKIDVKEKKNISIIVEDSFVDRSASVWHSTSSEYKLYGLNINDFYQNRKFDATQMDLPDDYKAVTGSTPVQLDKLQEKVQKALDKVALVMEGINEICKEAEIVLFE